MGMNVFDRNAGFAAGQAQIIGFGKDTGIDSKSYGAPGAKIFYVDPNNPQATDLGNLGEDPTVPLATVQAAVNLCRDHAGDTIYVGGNDAWQYAPGNKPIPIQENVIVPVGKGGIRIVGMSTNPLGVMWEAASNAGICLMIRAIDVLVEGFAFVEDTFNNTIGLFIEWTGAGRNGENAVVRNCHFNDMLAGIAMDFSWYNQIYDCYFERCTQWAITNTSITGDADYTHIHDCTFYRNVAAIDLPTSDGNFIYNNRIVSPDPAAVTATMINLDGTDNLVSDNYLACTTAQANTLAAKGANDFWVFNHCTDGEH